MGQGYAKPTEKIPSNNAVAGVEAQNLQPRGNEAMKDKVAAAGAPAVKGPLGRMWNHILGAAEGTDTSTATATRAQVRGYLDGIGLAEGEYFRGTKLDGVADKLIETYDTDKSGGLSWGEFQGFATQLTDILSGPQGAAAEHGTADKSKDGKANLSEIQSRTASRLPEGTDHKDLIAQLGARATLDAADTDQKKDPVSKKTLSADEWNTAAKELGGK